MKGRWAAGIVPRNFSWIVKDRLAVSERPGGYAPHHRPVRRQEEILWISAQGFTRVISLLPSSHNLRAYEELNLPSAHFPLPTNDDAREILGLLYPAILGWLRKGDRLLIHQEELGERVAGVMAGFLYWSGMFAEPPQAISAIEQLLRRQLGSAGRTIVAQSVELSPPVDEYGVPLPRRAMMQSSLLGMPGALNKVGLNQPVGKSTDVERATTSKATKQRSNISAIRPVSKATKAEHSPTVSGDGVEDLSIKKRSSSPPSASKHKAHEDGDHPKESN